MKKIFDIIILLLTISSITTAYEYRMPVNINCEITPSVLIPGDEALLAITLENGAASYGVGGDAGSGTKAQSTLLSTPINRTKLSGTPLLKVISDDFNNLGMIGPNDKITIYYKIKASENISSGTYLMDLAVVGGYDMIPINREIPVKVDASAVAMARAESSSTKTSFNINVANPRENTINAVTISPSSRGIRFSPDEYYIGTMDPDEVFTISFGLESSDTSRTLSGPKNISFVAKFKNGDNWHESKTYVASYTPPKNDTNQNSYLLPVGAVVLILFAAGGYLYRKRFSSRYR
jgi:hypothetical protein